MKIEEMKRFARDLRRHAGVAGLKLSAVQAMTARIHGRRDWHHLEQEGPLTSLTREEKVDILTKELMHAGSSADPRGVADAILPARTFSPLPEEERHRFVMWNSEVTTEHLRRHQYAARLDGLPAGGVMILNGDWAMGPACSNKAICAERGIRNLDIRPITRTARTVAWLVKHAASGSFREDANTEAAIDAAIAAVGDGADTVITVQNMERQIAGKGKRAKESVAALARIAIKTGSRLVFVIDDEHTDRSKAEAALKSMECLKDVHVESFDFAHYDIDDPAFGEYVDRVLAELPMPAGPIQAEDLAALHAMTGGMVENVEGFFSVGMDHVAQRGQRIETMDRRALAECAQARREQMGEYIDIDHNPFTGEAWKDQGEERRRRLRREREEEISRQGDPIAGMSGLERAVRYDVMEDCGEGSQLELLAERNRAAITIARIMGSPVALSQGHFHEGERWWVVVDGVAFKLRISAGDRGRWSISIGTPGMKSRYDDGAFRFDRARYEGWITIHSDEPVDDGAFCRLQHQDAEDAMKSVAEHVLAATDPGFPAMTKERRRLLGRVLRVAAEASGSVNGYVGLQFGSEPLTIGLTAADRTDAWKDAVETLRQEVLLAFPDAAGRWQEGCSLRGGSIHTTNRHGAREEAGVIERRLARIDVPTALKDAILGLTSPSLVPADQRVHLDLAN